MNIFTIKNDKLSVDINSLGANLWSIKDREGTEYLWQGDVNTWPDKSMNLFPYIARLTQGKYQLFGQEYQMDIHGFAKDLDYEVKLHTDTKVIFEITDSEVTINHYPYHFTYQVCYELLENKIYVSYAIKNHDDKTMYFGVGGHPGFNVPLEKELDFSDYSLVFSEQACAKRVGMSDDCFCTGKDEEFSLKNGKELPLRHEMFDDDAIILKDMSKEVTLISKKGKKGVRVSYPQMNYLGIWHWPKVETPYVCIEPWSSLPSRKDVVENLEKQENLISLEAGKTYLNTWCIEIF